MPAEKDEGGSPGTRGQGGFQAKAGERFILTLCGALFVVFVIMYLLTNFHRLDGWQETTAWTQSPAQFQGGYNLVEKLGCQNCHLVVDVGEYGAGPALDGEGTKRTRGWLQAFFQDPKAVDPGTRHDGVAVTNFKNLSAAQKDTLVNFLVGLRSLPGSVNYPKPPS